MPRRVNNPGAAIALVAACAFAPRVGADPGLKFDGEAWVPALAVISSGAAVEDDAHVDRVALSIGAGTLPEPEAATGSPHASDTSTVRAMLLIAPETQVAGDASAGGSASDPDAKTAKTAKTATAAAGPAAFQRSVLVVPVGAAAPAGAGNGGAATDDVDDEIDKWVPAFAVYSGAIVQSAFSETHPGPADMAADSFPVPQECYEGTMNILRCPAHGTQRMISPFVGAQIEVMSPGAKMLPGSPRVFIHGGAEASFPPDYDIAKEGVPSAFDRLDIPNLTPQEFTVSGQGTVTTAKTGTLMVNGGVGVAFTVDAMGRRLRVRPSVEYKRETIEFEGELRRAVAIVPEDLTAMPVSPQPDEYPRELVLHASESKDYHGIGPGLEVEMDAGRAGPFMMTVFIGGKAYRFLGDRTLVIEASNERGEQVEFEYENHRWAYEGGLGVRFRWLPE